MLHITVVNLNVEEANETIVCSGNQEVTAFEANEFWQSMSVTNSEKLTPLDHDNLAAFQPSLKPYATFGL